MMSSPPPDLLTIAQLVEKAPRIVTRSHQQYPSRTSAT